jgi:hypothetical protein
MIAPLDVFALRNGEPKWLDSTDTLDRALELIRLSGAGSYFVFSQTTQHKNFYVVSRQGEISQEPSR